MPAFKETNEGVIRGNRRTQQELIRSQNGDSLCGLKKAEITVCAESRVLMKILPILLSLALAMLAGKGNLVAAETTPEAEASGAVSFYHDVRPVFQGRCQGCHQPAKDKGDYVMTDFARMLAGGEEGVAIVPGKPEESYLLEQITVVDGKAEMPKKDDPLTEPEIALIRRWIAEGALDDTPESARQLYDRDHPPVYSLPPVITSLDYSPDGTMLAVAGFHEVLLHKADGSELLARLVGVSERIESVRFSPDGKSLAVSGGQPGRMGEVQVWDVAKRSLALSVPVTYDTVYGASWSPDGTKIAFGCADNSVRAIDAATGKQVLFQGAHSDWVFDTVFSTDGKQLVSVGRDMSAKLIEVETQRFVDNITSITPGALKGGIGALARHPSLNMVAMGGSDGVPRLYRMNREVNRVIGDDSNLVRRFPEMSGRIFGISYSRDGARFVACSSLDGKGMVRIYSGDFEMALPGEIKGIFGKVADQRSAEQKAQVEAYYSEGVKTLGSQALPAPVYAAAFSPDGASVAVAGGDGMIRILDGIDASPRGEFAAAPVETTVPSSERDLAVGDEATTPSGLPRIPINETPVAESEVAALEVTPSEIALDGQHAYAQLLVNARLKSGDLVDVTRIATFAAPEGVAGVDALGSVRGTANGAGTLGITYGGGKAEVPVSVVGMEGVFVPDYVRDVMPVISRLGCNQGTCHGSKDGKNGFKLSLRGYDPIYDIRAFTDDLAARRVNVASPDQSLMLLKSTGSVPHEGKQVVRLHSEYYNILRDWIGKGAKLDLTTPRVTGIEVYPVNPIVQETGAYQQMRVVATYADGKKRDVTREAFVESGNTEVAEAVKGQAAMIRTLRRGEAPVLVRFEGSYAATTVTVMGDRSGFVWEAPPTNNEIDAFVAAKLRRTKTLSSGICDDYEFVRRLYLDLTGLPPTPEQVSEFIDDTHDSRWKREKLIDMLVGNPDYVDYWTNKWADLLQVNRKYLGPEGAKAFRDWIRERVDENTPYDDFAREILTASGSNKDNPPASYYKILRTPEETMENTTHLFLATRFNCNKCHDHPFERWTQDQYYQMSAFFAQVGLERDPQSGDRNIGGTAVEGAKPLYELVIDRKEGEVKHDRTGEVAAPEFPYPSKNETAPDATRRERLAGWITSPDNRYFAASFVNRIWGYLTGTGIIEPLDDIRAGNPPSNPELLAWLTERFVESGFDSRALVRLICKSRTYQLSIRTNEWNADDTINFSHAKARRLPAEVLYDTIYAATGATSKIPGVPAGTRAAALPDAGVELSDGFLSNFGRPSRESACECERSSDLQLGPIMALISGPTVGDAISDEGNAIAKLVASEKDDRRLVADIFMRLLNRPATTAEVDASVDIVSEIEREDTAMKAELESYLVAREPELLAEEGARANAIAEARLARDSYAEEIKPREADLDRQRTENIATREAEVKNYEAHIGEALVAWEDSLKGDYWTVLDPKEMKAGNGAHLAKEGDLSIFASGPNGKGDYTITAETKVAGITAIRLEAMTDDRLPGKGPGRSGSNGNFVVTEFEVSQAPLAEPEKAQKVTLAAARADFSQGGYDVATAIDGKLDGNGNGWAISSEEGKPHVAVFETRDNVGAEGGTLLAFVLKQNYQDNTHSLGRFRLSVTTAPRPVNLSLPGEVTTLLAIARDQRDQAQKDALLKYFRENDGELKRLQGLLAEAQKPRAMDPKLKDLTEAFDRLVALPPVDPKHARMRHDIELSAAQLAKRRLTAAQDVVWAIINTPAFLFNH